MKKGFKKKLAWTKKSELALGDPAKPPGSMPGLSPQQLPRSAPRKLARSARGLPLSYPELQG